MLASANRAAPGRLKLGWEPWLWLDPKLGMSAGMRRKVWLARSATAFSNQSSSVGVKHLLINTWVWVKINPPGTAGFLSLVPFDRVSFIFDPQPPLACRRAGAGCQI